MDVNKILNSPQAKGVAVGLPQSLNMLQMGLNHFTTALEYNPYNVQLNKQSIDGKALMACGGKLTKKQKKMLAEGGFLEDEPGDKVKLQPGVKITPKTTQDKINEGFETGKYANSTPFLESIINTGLGFSPIGNAIGMGAKSMDSKFDPSDLLNFIPHKGFLTAGQSLIDSTKGLKKLSRQARNAKTTGRLVQAAPFIGDAQNTGELINEWSDFQVAKANNEKYKKIDSGLEKMHYGDGGTLEGPRHESGGIDVNKNGTPTTGDTAVAEVEGNEYKYRDPKTGETYIFSDRLPYKTKKK